MSNTTNNQKIIQLLKEYNNKFGVNTLEENKDIKIIDLLKEYNSKYELLTEASKLKILTDKNKWGMPEEQAKVLDDIFGSLSVWMAKKIGEYYSNILPGDYPTPKDALSKLFLKGTSFREQFNSIKDYIVVGLNGNKSSLDNLNYNEIYEKSKKWHDSLNIGDGEINYIEPEDHTIIEDFRENGEGYYWVALNTQSSNEECERMGHCGRSSYGYLYSLRSDKKLPGGKFKINRSHLTASIGTNGVLYQLKGPKNSKPKEEFHKYILPLFSYEDDGDYLISRFGTEYAAQQDFKLEDLPIETLKELYQNRSELFKSRGLQSKMRKLGIEIEVEPLPTAFAYDSEFDRITDIIDGDEVVGNKKVGRNSYNIYLSEVVLSKDFDFIYNKFDEDFYSESWEDILETFVYEGLKSHIRRLLMMMVERDEENIKLIKNYENKDLIDFITEVDVNDDIKNALLDKYKDALLEPYIDTLYQSLIDTLKMYGDVTLDNSFVTIRGDLSNFVDMDDPEVIDVYERVESENDAIYTDFVFFDLVSYGTVPKAEWRIPAPEDVDLDEDKFNDLLNDELNEIENRI